MDVFELYIEQFKKYPPAPYGVPVEQVEQEVRRAIEKGRPIPEDFDWYGSIPDDADA